MRALKMMTVVGALGIMLAAGPAWAQTPPPQNPPAQPPATQPPATQPPATPPAGQTPPAPAPTAQPPAPYPEGAKVAHVDLQLVAANSVEGKAASAKIQDFQKKKQAELADKQKALKGMQDKLQQGGSVLSDAARGQLEKEIDKASRELQFAQQDANAELEQMQNELQVEFNRKLSPVLQQVAQEKGLHYLLSIRDAGVLYMNPGLDLSMEVVKRFDAATKTAPPPKK